MKKIVTLIILLSIITSVCAEQLSTKKAVLLSALVPGLGEIYTKDYTKAGIFLSTELAIIFSYMRLKSETEWAIKSYEQFAYSKADIPKNSSDRYYQRIQDYFSSEEYNESVISFARNVYLSANSPYYNPAYYYEYLDLYLIPDEQAWDWQNNKNWYKYKDLRREKQDFEILMNFTFGAAILNRIVSIIDSAISVKKVNRKNSLLGNLVIEPDWKKKGMRISYEYNF